MGVAGEDVSRGVGAGGEGREIPKPGRVMVTPGAGDMQERAERSHSKWKSGPAPRSEEAADWRTEKDPRACGALPAPSIASTITDGAVLVDGGWGSASDPRAAQSASDAWSIALSAWPPLPTVLPPPPGACVDVDPLREGQHDSGSLHRSS